MCVDFQDAIKDEVTAIKTILTTHHKLMSDIRTILKSMSKVHCFENNHFSPN
jgi:hypothetical protein